ncbi:MAG: aspartate kinase [Magnetococcales bacterium]|nr:aspartate kinase [Magnetococcales bacterium]MBF0149632.1 aspartate kinase [Magnetococcales bacterium]MBF0172478.1 aspartate kinase [Magnetococcales bacterium]MBF0347563.1 aspartate kinase [Magnetococcales bacterium]MBF0632096.1 aspartate kinase [Magnetococcales bacterium]
MSLIVQKFGGTSVGSIERIRNVAARAIAAQKAGHQVVVTVSAMSGETNRLVAMVEALTPSYNKREYDVVVSAGEQISIGLLAIAIDAMGAKARSYLGWQVRFLTDNIHSKARIQEIESDRIRKDLDEGYIVVVAGFQGVTDAGDVTTLGRGGSDTSAVALAAALKADLCDIYTDVDGVYTTDPRIEPKARKMDRISYDEMLEMASLGAKVLQTRSVELAKKYSVPVRVLSSLEEGTGTLLTVEDQTMEKVLVSAIAYNNNEAKITIIGVPDSPGVAASIFGTLAGANINVDMIIQNVSAGQLTDLTFTVPKADFKQTMDILKQSVKTIGARDVTGDTNIAKISAIGVGMRSHSGVAQKMFKALADERINIQMISTSEIKISVVIDEKYTELAVRTLHSAFELDKERGDSVGG